MAVKPITNKQVVSSQGINRAEQRSTRNITNKSGNRAQSINPGNNLSDNYAITLKDLDTSMISHVKTVMRPSIKEANEVIKVPVLFVLPLTFSGASAFPSLNSIVSFP